MALVGLRTEPSSAASLQARFRQLAIPFRVSSIGYAIRLPVDLIHPVLVPFLPRPTPYHPRTYVRARDDWRHGALRRVASSYINGARRRVLVMHGPEAVPEYTA